MLISGTIQIAEAIAGAAFIEVIPTGYRATLEFVGKAVLIDYGAMSKVGSPKRIALDAFEHRLRMAGAPPTKAAFAKPIVDILIASRFQRNLTDS
jgi:hypothetical protein